MVSSSLEWERSAAELRSMIAAHKSEFDGRSETQVATDFYDQLQQLRKVVAHKRDITVPYEGHPGLFLSARSGYQELDLEVTTLANPPRGYFPTEGLIERQSVHFRKFGKRPNKYVTFDIAAFKRNNANSTDWYRYAQYTFIGDDFGPEGLNSMRVQLEKYFQLLSI